MVRINAMEYVPKSSKSTSVNDFYNILIYLGLEEFFCIHMYVKRIVVIVYWKGRYQFESYSNNEDTHTRRLVGSNW